MGMAYQPTVLFKHTTLAWGIYFACSSWSWQGKHGELPFGPALRLKHTLVKKDLTATWWEHYECCLARPLC